MTVPLTRPASEFQATWSPTLKRWLTEATFFLLLQTFAFCLPTLLLLFDGFLTFVLVGHESERTSPRRVIGLGL
jgi:hypothetical protein